MRGRKTRKTGAAGGRENEDSGRKHLTGGEVEKLLDAAQGGRNGTRDRCLLLLMFRHGLRVSEACRLTLDQVDTESRVLHVRRFQGSSDSIFAREKGNASRKAGMAPITALLPRLSI
jgi:integrase